MAEVSGTHQSSYILSKVDVVKYLDPRVPGVYRYRFRFATPPVRRVENTNMFWETYEL